MNPTAQATADVFAATDEERGDFACLTVGELSVIARGLHEVMTILQRGREKHPTDEGFRETTAFYIERAENHLEALARGDMAEDHLGHAATRLLMAMEARRR